MPPDSVRDTDRLRKNGSARAGPAQVSAGFAQVRLPTSYQTRLSPIQAHAFRFSGVAFETSIRAREGMMSRWGWAALLAALMVACDDATAPVEFDWEVVEVNLAPADRVLVVGDTMRLTVYPKNADGVILAVPARSPGTVTTMPSQLCARTASSGPWKQCKSARRTFAPSSMESRERLR